jgi:TPR repeat protein
VTAFRLALTFALTLAAAGAARADFLTGEAAFKSGNYNDAYLQLLGPGHAGDPRAQYLLGQLSDSGLGPIALDPREAVRWYKLAADKKYPEAQYALARAYALGRGVAQNKDQSLTWLKSAAGLDFEPAMLDLAELFDSGRGIDKDPIKATALIERAAEFGNPDAQYLLGERLAAGTGVLQDKKKAWTWFKRAADAGQPAALYRMGRVIFVRDRSIEDNIQAYAWLTLASQRGSGDVKRDAASDRATLAKDMTPGDISAAMQRVKAWKPAERPTSPPQQAAPASAPKTPSAQPAQPARKG